MAWLGIFFTYMDMQEHKICRVYLLPPYTRGEKKNIWSELELNLGPLASQATTLTTRPWLLGQLVAGESCYGHTGVWGYLRAAVTSANDQVF